MNFPKINIKKEHLVEIIDDKKIYSRFGWLKIGCIAQYYGTL